MERIGITASKIAKGNLFLYNFFVIVIASLFSALIFLISGLTIAFALVIIFYVINSISPESIDKNWNNIVVGCMISLTVVVMCFNFWAILKNIRLKK